MLRKVENSDRDMFIKLMSDFYETPAVNSVISVKHHERTFSNIINKSPLVDGYMIEVNHKVIGYVLLAYSYSNEIAGTVVWLEHIYIDKMFQHKGYGDQVMKELELMFDQKTHSFRLEVSESNKKLMNFYRKHGYKDRVYIQMHK